VIRISVRLLGLWSVTYHVEAVEAQLEGCASGETIVNTRADDHLLGLEYHPSELGSSRGGRVHGSPRVVESKPVRDFWLERLCRDHEAGNA
jgi:hypothetical protein